MIPGTRHGVVTSCGQVSSSVTGPPSVATAIALHRPASPGQESWASRVPTACSTQRSEPSGFGGSSASSAAPSSSVAVASGSPVLSPDAGDASGDALGSAGADASVDGVGEGVGDAAPLELASVVRLDRPEITVAGVSPTQAATSSALPIASTTSPDADVAEIVTDSAARSSTPGSVVTSPSAACAEAASVSTGRQTVAEATARPIAAMPKRHSSVARARWSTGVPSDVTSQDRRAPEVCARPSRI